MRPLPDLLRRAMTERTWRDPGPARLANLVGHRLDPDDAIALFPTEVEMDRVHRSLGALDEEGLRALYLAQRPAPGLLVLPELIPLGGSVQAGNDVLLVLDLSTPAPGALAPVKLLDWRPPTPHWRTVHTLQAFLARLHPANTPQQSGQ